MKRRSRNQKLLKLLDKVIGLDITQYDIVYVQWRDARNVAGMWTSLEDTREDAKLDGPIHTCGWLLAQEKGYILVGASIDPHAGNCDLVIKILCENIVSMKKLSKVKL